MVYDDRIIMIAEHYGFNAQTRQLIEEMAELTAAINRFWRKCLKCGEIEYTAEDDFRKEIWATREWINLLAEVSDVKVCLRQLEYMLDCDDGIKSGEEYKISRQLRRIIMEEKDGICTDDDRRLAGDQGQDPQGTEQREALFRPRRVLPQEGEG